MWVACQVSRSLGSLTFVVVKSAVTKSESSKAGSISGRLKKCVLSFEMQYD